jgi:hypothetical protein
MSIIHAPLNTDHLRIAATCTVTNNELRNYGYFDTAVAGMTITLPTPCEDLSRIATIWNETAGGASQTLVGSFKGGASATMEAYGTYTLLCLRVGANYKWALMGEVAVIPDLETDVDAYVDSHILETNAIATGTGFPHITSGVKDAAAKLVENADVHASAAIAASKVVQATGTGFPHVTSGALDAASKLVENADVHASAGIVESKLTLNYATHENNPKPYADLTAAELATSVDGKLCYVLSLGTMYRGLAAGGAYTRDGTYILNTADGGNTRWIGAAGTYVYHALNVSDGTNKAAVTAAHMKAVENANPTPTDYLVKLSDTGRVLRYADLTAAELATSVDGRVCFVISLGTLYEGIAAGAAYTRDATFVLNTADAGNTRWVGRAGKYVYNSLACSDGTNKPVITPAMLKALEVTNPAASDTLVKATNAGLLRIYADITAAKAATSVDGLVGVVLSLNTIYRGLAAGSAYTADDTNVLITGDGGNTRWVSFGGQYNVYTKPAAFTGTLGWSGGAPTVTTEVYRQQTINKMVKAFFDVAGTDGADATTMTLTFPAGLIPADVDMIRPASVLVSVAGGAYVAKLGTLDCEDSTPANRKLTIATGTLTDDAAFRIVGCVEFEI